MLYLHWIKWRTRTKKHRNSIMNHKKHCPNNVLEYIELMLYTKKYVLNKKPANSLVVHQKKIEFIILAENNFPTIFRNFSYFCSSVFPFLLTQIKECNVQIIMFRRWNNQKTSTTKINIHGGIITQILYT